MPLTRVYVPVGAGDLARLRDHRLLAAPSSGSGLPVFAPTSGTAALLGRSMSTPDEEEREFAAFATAVAWAAQERGSESGQGTPLVIAAADVDVAAVHDADAAGPGRVCLSADIPLSRVASFQVEDLDAAGESEADPLEFLWYDVTELAEVLELLA